MATNNQVERPQVDRPLKELVSGLGRDTGLLLRQEIELAKVELKEYASRAAKAGAAIGAGTLIAYAGVLAILAALVLLLIRVGVAPWAAAGIVGTAAIIAGNAILQGARRRPLAPGSTLSRTKQTTKETLQWAKEQLP